MTNKPTLIIKLTISAESSPSLYADIESVSPRKRAGLLRSYGEVYANQRDKWGKAIQESKSVVCEIPNVGVPILDTSNDNILAKELGELIGGMRDP